MFNLSSTIQEIIYNMPEMDNDYQPEDDGSIEWTKYAVWATGMMELVTLND